MTPYIKQIYTVLLLSAAIFTNLYADSFKSDWAVISSGGGASSGSSFANSVASIGQTAVGKSTETSKYSRHFAGFASGFITVQDVKITFYNPSPNPSTINEDLEVTCSITIKAFNNDIDTSRVMYQITNTGINNFTVGWSTGAVIKNKISNREIIYQITIPASGGENFAPGADNYIRYRCWDTGANGEISGAYQVTMKEPSIEIIQPVDFSSENPVFEVQLEGPLKISSVVLDIDKKSGEDVILISGSENYTSGTGKYLKQWTGNELKAGETYLFTATVEDGVGNVYTDFSEFVVNEGMVADLIPYPSPFDPNSEGVKIRYVLKEDADVSISIYNTSGDLILSLIENERRPAGLNDSDIWYALNFAGQRLANGIYICEIIADTSSGEYRRYTSLGVLRQ